MSIMLAHADELLAKLKQLESRDRSRKGKEREVEKSDEVGEIFVNLSGMLKRSDELKRFINKEELIRRYVGWYLHTRKKKEHPDDSALPFLADDSTPGRRAATYRILRLCLDRLSWGKMINFGIEWLIVR